MDTIKERLEKILEYTETYSVLRLAERIEIPKHFLYELNKNRTQQFNPKIIVALRKVYPEFRVAWLETGEPPMLDHNEVAAGDFESLFADFMLHEIAAIKAQAKNSMATDEYSKLKAQLDRLKSKFHGKAEKS